MDQMERLGVKEGLMYTGSKSRTAALQGVTVMASGLLMLGFAGAANAHTAPDQPKKAPVPSSDTQQQSELTDKQQTDKDSLVSLDHNVIPVDVEQIQLPVDVMGEDQAADNGGSGGTSTAPSADNSGTTGMDTGDTEAPVTN